MRNVLITGGGGFLGRTLVDQLLDGGGWTIRTLDLRYTEPMPDDVEAIEADLLDRDALARACTGMDAVVHAASLIDWGQATTEQLEAVNVRGVAEVVDACRAAGVRALVYTSSMDVACGLDPVVDATEDQPFPTVFTNDYSRTKAEGEVVALAANGPDLRVTSLRPCGMFGERDPYHLANVLRSIKSGRLPMRIGDGSARFQHVYVGNVAHAHVLALHDLLGDDPRSAGEAYYVTDDAEAVDFLEHLEPILTALGHRLPTRQLPARAAMAIGAGMEGVAAVTNQLARWIPFVPEMTPVLTRSSVRFLTHDHTFDGSKLRRDLDYVPKYSDEVAMQRTIDWWREAEAARRTAGADARAAG